jgi:hypothetical protein
MNTIGSASERHVNTIVDQDASLGAFRDANAPTNQMAEAPVVQVALANLDEIHARMRGGADERDKGGQALIRQCRQPMTISHQAAERARGKRTTPLATHRCA